MSVSVLVEKILNGGAASDSLSGGGTGVDLGNTVNGEYTPIINKTNNTGWEELFITHDAAVDPITAVATGVAEFSQTYGGANDAPTDLANIIAKGSASGSSANNADGLSGGLRIEMDADLGGTLGLSAFNATRDQVEIYGKTSTTTLNNGNNGASVGNAFLLHKDAMVQNNGGSPIDAGTPVDGQIGRAGDATLGDVGAVKLRYYLETAALQLGVVQWDWFVRYSFTS